MNTDAPFEPEGRDYSRLFAATKTFLDRIAESSTADDALTESFTAAADGFGAENALLLAVEQDAEPETPPHFRLLSHRGRLTPQQIEACVEGRSVPGVSPTVIRRVVETARPEVVQDPRLQGRYRVTQSLRGGQYSVLCAPILNPLNERPLAVLYFQNHGIGRAYVEADLVWLDAYVAVVGQIQAIHRALLGLGPLIADAEVLRRLTASTQIPPAIRQKAIDVHAGLTRVLNTLP